MKFSKIKLICLSALATNLIFSTSVFASGNISNSCPSVQTTKTSNISSSSPSVQTTKTSNISSSSPSSQTIKTSNTAGNYPGYDHHVFNRNTGDLTVYYNGYTASTNIYYHTVGYGYITSGEAVKVAQLLLAMHGYSLRIDSSFGSATYDAVLSYQNLHTFLTEDGVVGRDTWLSLIAV